MDNTAYSLSVVGFKFQVFLSTITAGSFDLFILYIHFMQTLTLIIILGIGGIKLMRVLFSKIQGYI